MRKRIRSLAKGNFEYIKPVLLISEKEISFDVFEGRDFEGSFQLAEQNQLAIRGMVYSSEPRMECETPQFSGKDVTIRFCFHSKGLDAGSRVNGQLSVCCSGCSLKIPFSASVVHPFYNSGIGKIRTLDDFTLLAKDNYEEAFRLFSNPGFSNLIDPKNTKIRMVYRALTAGRITEQSMEEFLVSTRQKEKINISIRTPQDTFTDVAEKQMAYIDVKKSTWGHSAIRVSCEDAFIQLSHNVITDDMFTGRSCRYLFYINPEKMHAGRNFARILLSMPYEQYEIVITASKYSSQDADGVSAAAYASGKMISQMQTRQKSAANSALQTPASKNSASQKPTSKNPALQTPASKNSALQTPASGNFALQNPASKSSASRFSALKKSASQNSGLQDLTSQKFASPSSASQTPASQIPVTEELAAEARLPLSSVREAKSGLVELYTAYRLKRIGTGVWANESIEILKKLTAAAPNQALYQLMIAQAYLMNHQIAEAEGVMNAFRIGWVDKNAPEWAYYLYLQTLEEREPDVIDKRTKEIRRIFRENPDSVLMFWVLSFLEEEYYDNNANKLKAIEYWVTNGCASPYLYLEAYCLMLQDPYLLSRLDSFEIRVLIWAAKHKALNRDIAIQIFEAGGSVRVWDPFVYRLLCEAYEIIPQPEYVQLICHYLIKAHRFEHEYLKWYRKGIELELRLAGLYEAYLLTINEEDALSIPKIVRMYFQYESPLPYQKIALLYRSVIRDKEKNPELYDKYRKNICRFATKQAAKGHMTDELAGIYNDILCLGLFSEDIAGVMADTVFAKKLTIQNPSIVKAIVYQWEMKEPQVVPVNHGVAYVQIYSEDYVILLEDFDGRRFECSVDYTMEPMIEWEKYLPHLMELAPDRLPYIIAGFRSRQSYTAYTAEDLKPLHLLMDSPQISTFCKAEIWPEFVHFIKKEGLTEDTREFYASLDYTHLTSQARLYLMDMIIQDGYFDLAQELVQEYGFDRLKNTNALALCNHMISEMPDEEDEMLTVMAADLFRNNFFSDGTLNYLCQFYVGPVDMMLRIYQSALASPEISVKSLEERILITVLFENDDPNSVRELFAHYLATGTTEIILMAYMSVCCKNYLLDGHSCDDRVFGMIESRYQKALELNDACRLALLKFYSGKGDLPNEQFRIADELLREYTVRNMNFAFFRQLDHRLVYKYHLYDKMFLEYRSAPGKHVVLHYTLSADGQDFISEDLPETWNGMYVKQFVVFFGESVTYYITEEEQGRTITTESNRLIPDQVYNGKNDSRYDRINQILMSGVLRDDVRMIEEMKKYVETEAAAASLFKVL